MLSQLTAAYTYLSGVADHHHNFSENLKSYAPYHFFCLSSIINPSSVKTTFAENEVIITK